MDDFFLTIVFKEFLAGTIHITIVYIVLALIAIYFLLFSRFTNRLIKKLNTKEISSESSKFTIVHVLFVLSVVILLVSIVFIGFRDYQKENFGMFMVFATLAFFFMPLTLGLLPVALYSWQRKKILWGNILLLVLFFCAFTFLGVHIHDVIWCFVRTNGLQEEHLAGNDLAFFFKLFAISDRSRWDYRTYFFYMSLQVLVEFLVASLAFIKFVKFQKKDKENFKYSRFIPPFVLLFIGSIALGIFVFIFDYPYGYNDLEIKLTVFLGIPLVIIIYIFVSFLLAKNNRYGSQTNTFVEDKSDSA